MVAALLQVHDHVEQRNLVSSTFGVQGFKVFRQDEFVVLPAENKQIKSFTPLVVTLMTTSCHVTLAPTHFCMGLSSTRRMSSVLEGMCLKTSAFSLLSM